MACGLSIWHGRVQLHQNTFIIAVSHRNTSNILTCQCVVSILSIVSTLYFWSTLRVNARRTLSPVSLSFLSQQKCCDFAFSSCKS